MKEESVAELLDSGEIQSTEDVKLMLDTVLALLERGCSGEPGGDPFLGRGLQFLMTWRESLEVSDTLMADEAIANIVRGKMGGTT